MSKKPKTLIIAAGGTGGHLYPAQGLAWAIKKQRPEVQIVFMGAGLENNYYFDKSLFDYFDVPGASLSLRSPHRWVEHAGKIVKGFWKSFHHLKLLNPKLIVGFGSYHTFPILTAAKMRNIPFMLHEANAVPGRVNRMLSPYALCTGIQFPEAKDRLKGKTHLSYLPVRPSILEGKLSSQEAKRCLGLKEERLTFLVFGGSQGAQAINRLVRSSLEKMLETLPPFQLIHLTGDKDEALEMQTLCKNIGITSYVREYEDQMEKVWSAADLVIARAGASTITEATLYHVPAILIPYPYATDGHQEKNAHFLTKQIGGALTLLEKEASPQKLLSLIERLLHDKTALLCAMKQALRLYRKRLDGLEFSKLVCSCLEQI